MILDKIAADTKIRVEEAKKEIPLEEMKARAQKCGSDTHFPFEKVFQSPGLHFICEVKKASPSKGLIAEDFPYVEIARAYERAGAGAVSVLTEPHFFQGSNDYLREIRKEISIPILRKDFTIDAYQIYEAKSIGADAVLLIAALLDLSLIHILSQQLSDSYIKQEKSMKELITELGSMQSRYMSTANRIVQENQEIQKMQQQDYQHLSDYLGEAEKSAAKFWVACNQTMQKYVEKMCIRDR